MKVRITNTQSGPRGLHSMSGPMVLEPRQSAEVHISDAELRSSRATGWFDIAEISATESPLKKVIAARNNGAAN